MEKEFVPHDLALDLAKLNFNEKCFGYYGIQNELKIEISSNLDTNLTRRDFYAAPTYSQAFRWFREKYNMNHSIILHETTFSNDYQYLVLSNDNEFVEVGYTTHEEAELACLQKLIEIVKTK